ncbi:MAG: hypothetical protein EB078_10660 [Proteobacteria bacterium]|nr:hypothetical protein [Pseudomonadota bacterium]NDD05357.1 hypothetical protein [Pseudomonadota bacterium]
MSFLLIPFALVFSFLTVISSLLCRLFSVVCAVTAYILGAMIIKINNDRFHKFIISVLTIGELSGYMNNHTEVDSHEKKIQ